MVRTKRSQPEADPTASAKATRTSTRKRARDDGKYEDDSAPALDTPTKRRGARGAPPGKPTAPTSNASLASAYDFPGSDQDEPPAASEPLPTTPSKRARGRPKTTRPDPEPKSTKATPNRQSDYDVPSSSDELAAEPPTSASPTKKTQRRAAPADQSNPSDTPRNRKTREPAVETPVKSTPLKARASANGETPRWRRNDRSARKKSARALIEKVVNGDASDEDEDLARQIYESSDEENDDENERALNAAADTAPVEAEAEVEAAPATPSKRPRGRPRKTDTTRARKKSPTPPRDLPAHELYFAQNRPGSTKTSDNNLSGLKLLTHEEYFSIAHEYRDPHAEDMEFLESIHLESFPQWSFELSQGFSVCLYGFGSKRAVLHKFAQYLFDRIPDHDSHRIVVVNGYARASSLREILGAVAGAVDRAHRLPAGGPAAMLDGVRDLLAASGVRLTLLVHSLDAAPLRRPGAQAALSRLAALPGVRLAASVDTPDFAMLWDSGLRSAFGFAFHDATTFRPPAAAELDVVDDVHDLLGRRARRVGGKEGAIFVLRSLTENARSLFRLLVGECLVLAEDEDGGGGGGGSGESAAVEYRMLYNKAVEEFICSSEMAYRGLLKEFYDHQIITSRKDVLGTELLSIPFQKEELEAILEDLMS